MIAARNQLSNYENRYKFELLATQRFMGKARDELKPQLRSRAIGHYIVFYVPVEDGIAIARILKGHQDINTDLFL